MLLTEVTYLNNRLTSVSLDLIFCVPPQQSLEDWEDPETISVIELKEIVTVEGGQSLVKELEHIIEIGVPICFFIQFIH